MLNKQICKRCVNEEAEKALFSAPMIKLFWSKQDIGKWGRGFVHCPFSFPRWKFIEIENSPPDDCYYLVEQFLCHSVTEIEANAE